MMVDILLPLSGVFMMFVAGLAVLYFTSSPRSK